MHARPVRNLRNSRHNASNGANKLLETVQTLLRCAGSMPTIERKTLGCRRQFYRGTAVGDDVGCGDGNRMSGGFQRPWIE